MATQVLMVEITFNPLALTLIMKWTTAPVSGIENCEYPTWLSNWKDNVEISEKTFVNVPNSTVDVLEMQDNCNQSCVAGIQSNVTEVSATPENCNYDLCIEVECVSLPSILFKNILIPK